MIRKNSPALIFDHKGFTLVELMITMVMFVFVVAAMSNIFSGLLGQFKQQSRVAESNIEGVVGLELLRYDVEQAGFGLPWVLEWSGITATYSEAIPGAPVTSNPWNASLHNDSAAPRAFVLADNIAPPDANSPGLNNSDYLVVRATNVGTNNAAHKYSQINNWGSFNTMTTWNAADDNLATGDYVIVQKPNQMATYKRVLINNGNAAGTWTTFNAVGSFTAAFQPGLFSSNSFIVYGIGKTTAPRMPFNRADYYVRRPQSNVPSRCAPGTGMLYKATVNHADGKLTELPLLDCVADMQVVIGSDTSTTGTGQVNLYSTSTPGASATAAETVRNQMKEIRIYILTHDGQMDPSYQFTNQANLLQPHIYKIEDPDAGLLNYGPSPPASAPGLNLLAAVGANYLNYRWKLYTLIISPYNLK
ncbi:MAG: prepilin-type N-terminal cleavage/methylation domain-containing protein [Nitrospirae bacterium]|nr:prepilin-type N-terminal cleavage/methylation domain-containing protein [Nitrospirota bacterium]